MKSTYFCLGFERNCSSFENALSCFEHCFALSAPNKHVLVKLKGSTKAYILTSRLCNDSLLKRFAVSPNQVNQN